MNTWQDGLKRRWADPPDGYYEDGYRAGWLDHRLGMRSIIALTSPLHNYASAYADGQRDAERHLRGEA